MWKKDDSQEPDKTPSNPPPARARSASSRSVEGAVIGPSIAVRGDVTGAEDLLIQGKVEGKVDLEKNNVTIGEHGKVEADLFGRNLTVEGSVNGNLFGQERVVVRSSGTVIGNITSPRVHLEDGATFKGKIDMDSKSARRSASPPAPSASSSQKKDRESDSGSKAKGSTADESAASAG